MRDFSDLRGQEAAVRAVSAAVLARKHSLLIGPPGVGKTAIASRIPGLFGPTTNLERTWLAAEYADLTCPEGRPFRAPHHTVSAAALAGQPRPSSYDARFDTPCRCKAALPDGACRYHVLPRGPVPRACEARLARFGVLFLDELPEFARATIEALHWCLVEMGDTAPLIVAAANPCLCGWWSSEGASAPSGASSSTIISDASVRECSCSASMRQRHNDRLARLSAILGAFTTIVVPPVSLAEMRSLPPGPSTAELRAATSIE